MKYKIISDSSCSLDNNYLKETYNDDEIGFEVIPFVVTVDGTEYIDGQNDDLREEMLDRLKDSGKKVSSSCPAPYYYENSYSAECNFVITISSKLSGSYNSAIVASQSSKNNVFVIDSKGAGGTAQLIIDKLYKFIKKGLSFETIQKKIIEYRDSIDIYFTLTNYGNLVRKGRLNPIIAKIIQIARIKALCKGVDGEIELDKKFLTFNHCINWLKNIISKKQDKEKDECIITCVGDESVAVKLKDEISGLNLFKKIIIKQGKILHSFYALGNSLVVTY